MDNLQPQSELTNTSRISRKSPNILEERLRACLVNQYDLNHVILEFLPVGHDYNAGVYRVVSEAGAAYLLKVTSRPLYEPRCLVPRYLNDQGIKSVVAPIPTSSGGLWTRLEDWTVIVYPFIEGVTSLTGMTDEQWKELGSIFKQIHHVALPTSGFESMRKETFDPTEYARWIRNFEARHVRSEAQRVSERSLYSSWVSHQATIHMVVASLKKLARILKSQVFPYVICHADLHARNLIRDRAGHVFVIDWDEVMLAPKERDFIFIREPQAEAFFQGYGKAEIDWTVLTYYLWERVVQDLIECAQNVCFKDDWGEESRLEAVALFDVMLAEDRGHIAAAHAAATHLSTID